MGLDKRYFPLPLIVRHIDGRMWEVMRPFQYNSRKNGVIYIPPKYVFDFASIPKPLWSIIGAPTGKYGPASLVHDYLLDTNMFPRKVTDHLFLEAMRDLKVPYLKRQIMYLAVRVWSYF